MNTKALELFRGELRMEKLNLRIPKVICQYIDRLAAERGEAKVDLFLRGIASQLPEDLESLLGKEVYDEIIKKAQNFYEEIYANSDSVSFVVCVREHLLIDATTMTPEKRMKVAKHIFDIVYIDGGDTMTRNTFLRVLTQRNYLEQATKSIFELIKGNYATAVSKMMNSLKDFM